MYRCCQTILDFSYLVKWDVQSFLYEPRLKTNANGLDDHKSTVKCAHIFLATSPGLSVVKNSNYSCMDRWNLPSPLYEPRMRNSQWTIIMNGIVSMSMHCITSFRYQSQMLGRAPLPPCCNEASVGMSGF